MREAASRGFWVASRTPYGYNRVMVQDGAKKRPKLEPDEVTAPVVRHILRVDKHRKRDAGNRAHPQRRRHRHRCPVVRLVLNPVDSWKNIVTGTGKQIA